MNDTKDAGTQYGGQAVGARRLPPAYQGSQIFSISSLCVRCVLQVDLAFGYIVKLLESEYTWGIVIRSELLPSQS